MTTRKTIELQTIFYISLAAVVAASFVLRNNNTALPITLDNTSDVVTPLSSEIGNVKASSQTSPDGSRRLIMRLTPNANGTSTYLFSTSDSGGFNKKQFFQATTDNSEKFSIPFNAWSPDNKYFFIGKNGNDALIFRADGGNVTENEKYIDVLSVFGSKNKTLNLKEVTGWASETLVIFNSLDQNNRKISYWLEIPSKALIPLASQF